MSRAISLLEAQYAAGVSSHRTADVVAQSVAREISKVLKIHLKTTSEDNQFAYSPTRITQTVVSCILSPFSADINVLEE